MKESCCQCSCLCLCVCVCTRELSLFNSLHFSLLNGRMQNKPLKHRKADSIWVAGIWKRFEVLWQSWWWSMPPWVDLTAINVSCYDVLLDSKRIKLHKVIAWSELGVLSLTKYSSCDDAKKSWQHRSPFRYQLDHHRKSFKTSGRWWYNVR